MSLLNNPPFEWQVGLRYTRVGRRSRRNHFISFISLISMAGIALGVTALIVVLSVMNGFEKEVVNRMLSVVAHIDVIDARGAMTAWRSDAQEVLRHPEVKAAAPYVAAQAMLTRDDIVRGVSILGLSPPEEAQVSGIATLMREGRLDDLKAGEFNIVLGAELARELRVKRGDKVNMLGSDGQIAAGGAMPQLRQFRVSGIFEAGHYEYDSALAMIHIEDAYRMFKLNAPIGLRLKVAEMQRAPEVARDLSRTLSGDMLIRDWSKQNRIWFSAVQAQKRMMFIILGLIIAVAAFNLVATLVMTVTDKQADIAILRTLGASPGAIMRIFVIQGALAGLLGTAIGVGLGVTLALNIDVIIPAIERVFGVAFIAKDIYFISTLPSDLRWPDVWSIGAVAIVLALLATLSPSWWAARVKPADALRYE